MNMIEQLEQKRDKLGMNDLKFASYLGISRQLWQQVKSGQIKKSNKVESAAWKLFHIAPDTPQDDKRSSIMDKIKGLFHK
jgi:DNA-binding transcriptional regulator YiaG